MHLYFQLKDELPKKLLYMSWQQDARFSAIVPSCIRIYLNSRTVYEGLYYSNNMENIGGLGEGEIQESTSCVMK